MRLILFFLLIPFALSAQVVFPILNPDTTYVGLDQIHYIQDAPSRRVALFDKTRTAPLTSNQYAQEIIDALGYNVLVFTVTGGDTIMFNKNYISRIVRSGGGKAIIFSSLITSRTWATLEDYDDIFASTGMVPMGTGGASTDSTDALRDDLTDLQGDVADLQDTSDVLRDDITDLQGDVNGVGDDVADLIDSIAVHRDSIDAISARLTGVEEDDAALLDSIAVHRDSIDAISGRLTGAETNIVNLQDSIAAHRALIDALGASGVSGDTIWRATVSQGWSNSTWENAGNYDSLYSGYYALEIPLASALTILDEWTVDNSGADLSDGYVSGWRTGTLNISADVYVAAGITAGLHNIIHVMDFREIGYEATKTVWVVTDIPYDYGIGDFSHVPGKTFGFKALICDTFSQVNYTRTEFFNRVKFTGALDTMPVSFLAGFTPEKELTILHPDSLGFGRSVDVAALQDSIDVHRDSIDAMSARLTAAEGDIANLIDSIAVHRDSIDALSARLTAAEEALQEAEETDVLQAETTALDTAEVGKILLVNSSGGAINIDPPLSPTAGQWFAISDSRGTADTNNITVRFVTQSQLLHTVSENFVLNTENAFVRFTYVNGTIGWIISN